MSRGEGGRKYMGTSWKNIIFGNLRLKNFENLDHVCTQLFGSLKFRNLKF